MSESIVDAVHGILREAGLAQEIGWDRINYVVEQLRLAHEYREACEDPRRYMPNAREALLEHAYNGGKAP